MNEHLIFVFGSNLAGRHGKGAALFARHYRGAVYGQGEGLQGRSYALQRLFENPGLLDVLRAASGLSDIFGQPGHCCQATELWRIRGAT